MLEPTARSGPARRVAWTRGETTVHTPLLLARPEAAALLGGVLHGVLGPVADAARPTLLTTGAFLEAAPAPPAAGGPWAHIEAPRALRIEAQLALTRRLPRAVVDLPGWSDEDGEEEEADPRLPFAGGETRNGSETAEPATGLVQLADEVAVVPAAAALAGDPQRFAALLVAARREAGPAQLLYAPGVGLPHHLALLSYAGIDLFDTLAAERATLTGHYLTSEGVHDAATLTAPLCPCAACAGTSPRMMSPELLLTHNLTALADEITRVTGHIENDTLRALAETRARAHPGAAAFLRRLDAWRDHFTAAWPLAGRGTLHATTLESLSRPDVARFRDRIRFAYIPPANADVLLLLPCSATKPYHRSKSHRVYQRVLGDLHQAARIHEVIVTSPLGVVPRELEHTWPAAHYDVPVTGHYDGEEVRMIRDQVRALLARSAYTRVVSHLDAHTHRLIADLLPADTPHTASPHPTHVHARDALRRALKDATADGRAPAWPKRRLADAAAILSWQFGADAARVLTAATVDVSGRPPALRLYGAERRGLPLATFVIERGLFVLTLAGAQVLLKEGLAKTVMIEDFLPRGTLFAVGVKDADPTIVPDDEVVLLHEDEVRGVGRARMTGDEMRAFRRGAAVEVRHHA